MPAKIENSLVQHCIGARVRILNRVVTGIYDEKLRALGVRVSQVNVLAVVAGRGPLPATEIGRLMCLEKSTLSRDLARLIQRSWIRSLPGPARSQQLEATTAGQELLRSIESAWKAAQSEVEKLLGSRLIAELHRVVDGGKLARSE